MGLTLLAHSSTPLTYWAEAFQTASYLINRLPTLVLHNLSPFQKLFKLRPNYTFLRVFGCACWPHLRPYNQHKLAYQSDECIFLDYSPSHRGYKCLHLPSSHLYISRHVIFYESSFPFSRSSPSILNPPPNTLSSTLSLPPLNHPPGLLNACTTPHRVPPQLHHHFPLPLNVTPPSSLAPTTINTVSSSCTQVAPIKTTPPALPQQQHAMQTHSKNNIFKPKNLPKGLVQYHLPKALIATTCTDDVEPTSYSSAAQHPAWLAAMNTKFDALLSNGTWTLVPPTANTNIVGWKWVFRLKHKADGTTNRYKARLVTKGFHQQPGIDYGKTYSLVVKLTTIRLVLSLAISFGWPIRQIDVQNAFLHGWLSEDVYMAQPLGFLHPQYPTHVCKLHKVLYGLKQAPCAWFSGLSDQLLELGFIRSRSDSSLFTRCTPQHTTYVLIYVDDILITSSTLYGITSLLQLLQVDFAIKDLSPFHFFLGMEAISTPNELILSQQRYILDVFLKSNMSDVKPIKSPMPSTHTLSLLSGDPLNDPSSYRSLIGALQYLSFTRLNVSFAVNKVS
jgi:hypothetical protein